MCTPGCCHDESDFRMRMRRTLDLLFNHLFPVPLLYRWKYTDPACQYLTRGLAIHGLLRFIWRFCCDKDSADLDGAADISLLDEDTADVAPAAKQQVRMSKVDQMLCAENATAPKLKFRRAETRQLRLRGWWGVQ
jgi:hypothetical protein